VPSGRIRSRRRWLCGVAMLTAVTSCAAVPTSGPVHIAKALPAVAGGIEPPNVRQFPPGPTAGTTPVGLVGGFLDALLDGDSNYAVARTYLAPGTSWNSTSGITLYDENSASVTRSDSSQVQVSVHRVGIIDAQGSYLSAPGTLHVTLGVAKRDGQWRISALPAGVLLSTSDAAQSLQPVSIYYLNRTQTRLVPDPILVPEPDQPGLATTLVGALLAGPSRGLAPAVATAVPAGTSLVGNVPIDDSGVAEIDLAGSLQPSPVQLERLSAQLVWTLRQLPSITAIRLLDNGAPVSTSGVASVQPIGAWPQFDPQTPPTSFGALLSSHGHVAGMDRAVPAPLLHRTVFAPAVSANGATLAALQQVGKVVTLLIGPADGPLHARLHSVRFSSPTFDPQGDVVVVNGAGAHSTLVEVPRVGRPSEVDVSPEIRQEGISAIAMSRDGSRIAMVVGPPGRAALVVGTVSVTNGALVINGGADVIAAGQDVRGVAWAGANEIVTTVRVGAGHRAVVEATVDGYTENVLGAAGLTAAPTQVAAAPGQPLLAAAGGGIWALSDHRWKRVATGVDPSYAG
jgi:hypothetical protein